MPLRVRKREVRKLSPQHTPCHTYSLYSVLPFLVSSFRSFSLSHNNFKSRQSENILFLTELCNLITIFVWHVFFFFFSSWVFHICLTIRTLEGYLFSLCIVSGKREPPPLAFRYCQRSKLWVWIACRHPVILSHISWEPETQGDPQWVSGWAQEIALTLCALGQTGLKRWAPSFRCGNVPMMTLGVPSWKFCR